MQRPGTERCDGPTGVGLLFSECLIDQRFSGLFGKDATQLGRSPEPGEAIVQGTLQVGPCLKVRDERRKVLTYLWCLGVSVWHRSNRQRGERRAEKVCAGMLVGIQVDWIPLPGSLRRAFVELQRPQLSERSSRLGADDLSCILPRQEESGKNRFDALKGTLRLRTDVGAQPIEQP